MKDDFDVEHVLSHEYDGWDLEQCSIRHYLITLAEKVWEEGEGFSGKRPFGNSGWQHEVLEALADGGFIDATYDEDDYCVEIDAVAGRKIIRACFEHLRKGN